MIHFYQPSFSNQSKNCQYSNISQAVVHAFKLYCRKSKQLWKISFFQKFDKHNQIATCVIVDCNNLIMHKLYGTRTQADLSVQQWLNILTAVYWTKLINCCITKSASSFNCFCNVSSEPKLEIIEGSTKHENLIFNVLNNTKSKLRRHQHYFSK